MKKVLSIILLISMLMSMMLIVPTAAEEESTLPDGVTWSEPENVSTNIASVTNAVNINATNSRPFGQLFDTTLDNAHVADKTFAGSASHYCDLRFSSDKLLTNGQRYDLTGNLAAADATHKYLGYFDIDLTKVQNINNIKLYIDALNVGGVVAAYGHANGLLPQGFDLLVSKDGTTWTQVYSVSDLQRDPDGKYQLRENVGLDDSGNKAQQVWIDVKFDTTEARYVRVGMTEARWNYQKNDRYDKYFRFTEIEVYAAPKLVLPNGATWGPSENVSTGKAFVSNNVNITTSSGRPFGQLFDTTLDNAHGEGKKFNSYGHYCDLRIDPNNAVLTNGQRYDLTGDLTAADASHIYLGYFDIDLTKVQYIDNIKVYLDALNVGGVVAAFGAENANGLLLQGFDLLVSEDGAKWNKVYSVSDLQRDPDGKYQLRENVGLDDDGQKAQQVWIDVDFDITAARYVRVGVTEARYDYGQKKHVKYFRFTEIEVYGHDVILPIVEEEKAEEPAINSTMLFPLLMRHRQYETETSTTMFGLRVKHLLRSADAITFEKNGVKVDIPAATLKALNLAGSDKLVVTIVDDQVTVTVNGKAVDIEVFINN